MQKQQIEEMKRQMENKKENPWDLDLKEGELDNESAGSVYSVA